VGGVQIKHFIHFFGIDIMSPLFLDAGSSGDLRFAVQKFFGAVIGLKWGVFCHF
jgi:hypothetical protein